MWDLFLLCHWYNPGEPFVEATGLKMSNVGWIECVRISAWVLGQGDLRIWVQSRSWKYSPNEYGVCNVYPSGETPGAHSPRAVSLG